MALSEEAWRLRRRSWPDANMLADELFALLSSQGQAFQPGGNPSTDFGDNFAPGQDAGQGPDQPPPDDPSEPGQDRQRKRGQGFTPKDHPDQGTAGTTVASRRTKVQYVTKTFVGYVVSGTGKKVQVRLVDADTSQGDPAGKDAPSIVQLIQQAQASLGNTNGGSLGGQTDGNTVEVFIPQLADDATLPPGTWLLPVTRYTAMVLTVETLINKQNGRRQQRQLPAKPRAPEYIAQPPVWLAAQPPETSTTGDGTG